MLARANDEDSGAVLWLAGAPLLSMELANGGTGRQQPRAVRRSGGSHGSTSDAGSRRRRSAAAGLIGWIGQERAALLIGWR